MNQDLPTAQSPTHGAAHDKPTDRPDDGHRHYTIDDLPPFRSLSHQTRNQLTQDIAWITLPGGSILFNHGDMPTHFYVIASGTMGVFVPTPTGDLHSVAEIKTGEAIGEMSLLVGEKHSATLIALRHTELCAVPKPVFDRLIATEPAFLLGLTQTLVHRLQRTTKQEPIRRERHAIALVPIDRSLRPDSVLHPLLAQLKRDRSIAIAISPDDANQPVDWFHQMEQAHEIVFYQTDPLSTGLTPWTRFCLRQADRILYLAGPHTSLGDKFAPFNGAKKIATLPDLILVNDHTNARVGAAIPLPDRFQTIHHLRVGLPEDLARLARHLTNRSVGLVLAGGAARGFAHIGAIRALHNAHIPIDRVGGTSMGAIVGAGLAVGWDDREMRDRMYRAFVAHNPLDDYTIPWIALFKGNSVERLLRDHFGDDRIESFWRPFFCVSTNLTDGGQHLHRHGLIWRALRASIALPGVLPPVIENHAILVDGGVVNNFPVDVMANLAQGPIIGIDVSTGMALTPGDEGEVPPRDNPVSWLRPRPGPLPGIVSILSRVGTISSSIQSTLARAQVDLLIEPPLAHIALLDWRRFNKIIDVGYQATMEALDAADKAGRPIQDRLRTAKTGFMKS